MVRNVPVRALSVVQMLAVGALVLPPALLIERWPQQWSGAVLGWLLASALLATTARYAERVGADHVASLVPAHDRDTNRFFARLGFVPETVRRVTSVAMLQRRLAGSSPMRRSVAQVLQRRQRVGLPGHLTPQHIAENHHQRALR